MAQQIHMNMGNKQAPRIKSNQCYTPHTTPTPTPHPTHTHTTPTPTPTPHHTHTQPTNPFRSLKSPVTAGAEHRFSSQHSSHTPPTGDGTTAHHSSHEPPQSTVSCTHKKTHVQNRALCTRSRLATTACVRSVPLCLLLAAPPRPSPALQY
jgi:hypothetical protein